MEPYDVEELITAFDKSNPVPAHPYIDFLAFRKTMGEDGTWREHVEIFRADGRVASWATKTGLESLTSKGWQILRYGNFERYAAPGEPEPEEAQEMRKLCDSHISIRNGIRLEMQASKGIKAKLVKATETANVGK